MKRTFGIALAAALAVLLSGCMRMHVNLTLEEDNKASGNMVFAIADSVAEQVGMEPKALLESMLSDQGDMAPEGATAEDYAQDGFTGTKWSFESTDISEAATGQDITITRDGDFYVVDGEMDMTGEEFAGDELTSGMAEAMDIAVSITFPGPIESANGEIDGNTVTWQPEAGKVTEMDARGAATAGSSVNWPLILGIVLGLLVLGGIIAAILASKKRKGATNEPNYEYPTYSQQATLPSETGPGIATGAGLDGPGINANAAGAAAGAVATGAGAAGAAISTNGEIPVYEAPPTRASLRAAASAPESLTPASSGGSHESGSWQDHAPVAPPTGANEAAQQAPPSYEIPAIVDQDSPELEPLAEHEYSDEEAEEEATSEGFAIPEIERLEWSEPAHEEPERREPSITNTTAATSAGSGNAPAPTRDLFEPLELTEPYVPENDSPANEVTPSNSSDPETDSGNGGYTQELPTEVSEQGVADQPTQVFPQPPADPENPENPQQ